MSARPRVWTGESQHVDPGPRTHVSHVPASNPARTHPASGWSIAHGTACRCAWAHAWRSRSTSCARQHRAQLRRRGAGAAGPRRPSTRPCNRRHRPRPVRRACNVGRGRESGVRVQARRWWRWCGARWVCSSGRHPRNQIGGVADGCGRKKRSRDRPSGLLRGSP